MKKALFLLIGLQVVISAAAQDQPVQEALGEIATQREPQKELFAQKLKKFKSVVNYLNTARDCLRGIGCSKRQSYLANFALGAAIGAGNGLFQVALTIKVMKEKTRPGDIAIRKELVETTAGALLLLDLIATELGYRYIAKDKIQVFRCLTFRGCNDQTKRYVFFKLGSISSWLVVFNFMAAKGRRKEAQRQKEGVEFLWEKNPRTGRWEGAYRKGSKADEWARFYENFYGVPGAGAGPAPETFVEQTLGSVQVKDAEVKQALKLSPEQEYFQWYEVLGFAEPPDNETACRAYRRLTLKYHPDKYREEEAKKKAEEVFKAIANAREYF